LALACATVACATVALALGVDTARARHADAGSLIGRSQQLSGAGEQGSGQFGFSVALSGDGMTALVGGREDAAGIGAAWVFTRTGQAFSQQGPKLTGAEGEGKCTEEAVEGTEEEEIEECGFGQSVALSEDGNTALIGAPRGLGERGLAWVFTRLPETGEWTREALLSGDDEETGNGRFGRSVALSVDGQTALVGSPREQKGHGAVFVFTRAGSTWTQQAKLVAPNEVGEGFFGKSVAASSDGNTVLIGEPGEENFTGAAWVFVRSGSSWSAQHELSGEGEELRGHFGNSTALSSDGSTALVGARTDEGGHGSAFVFSRSEGEWTQQGPKLTGVGESEPGLFGVGTALSANGDVAMIGGPRTAANLGAAWIFTRTGSTWSQFGSELAPPDEGRPVRFGTSVALSGDGSTALAGGPRKTMSLGAAWALVDIFAGPEPKPPDEPPKEVPTQTPSRGTLASSSSGPGPPVLGVSGNVEPVSGTVRYRLPGTKKFILLTALRQIPFGTVIDARHGRVRVTTVGPHGKLQTIEFYEGEFKLTQSRSGRVLATLAGGNFRVCPTARERAHRASASATASARRSSRKHLVRKLWANGKGSYTTKGNYASGAVLGTRWLTEDRCNSTWIRVATDRVRVTNLINRTHKTVRAGQTYKAILPG
jgi:hypothetical protein